MPISEQFDPETRRILGVALEMTCIALRTGDCDDGVRQAIASKIIELAKAGERNPDILCEAVLKDIRGLEVAAPASHAPGSGSMHAPDVHRFALR